METGLLAIGLALSAMIAWSIGANDLANSASIAVGSGALSYRKTLVLFLAGLLMGALLQGFMVMKTLGKGVIQNVTIEKAVASSLAAFVWIIVASYLGAPVSTSQSITGAIIGVGIADWILTRELLVNLSVVYKIIMSWVVSPLVAIALSFALHVLLTHRRTASRLKSRRALLFLISFVTFMSAYSFGANDVANATGVYVTIAGSAIGAPDMETMRLLSLYASFFIFLGGYIFGGRVLRTMAYKITKLDLQTGLASGLANFLVVWIFTTIPYVLLGYGLPISTTYACAGSIIGVGIVRSRSLKGVSARTVLFITLAWVITLPVMITLSITFYLLIRSVVGV